MYIWLQVYFLFCPASSLIRRLIWGPSHLGCRHRRCLLMMGWWWCWWALPWLGVRLGKPKVYRALWAKFPFPTSNSGHLWWLNGFWWSVFYFRQDDDCDDLEMNRLGEGASIIFISRTHNDGDLGWFCWTNKKYWSRSEPSYILGKDPSLCWLREIYF